MSVGILKSSAQSLYLLLLHQNQPLYSGTSFIVMPHFIPLLVTGRIQETKRTLSTSGLTPDRMKIAHNRRDELSE